VAHEILIFGASGYSGLELLRWLPRHPELRVVGASSDRWSGRPARERAPNAPPGLVFSTHDAVLAEAKPGRIAFLATPADTSLELAPKLIGKGTRVIDLSGAFRLEREDYPSWYGFQHSQPELLAEACYGLPEIDRSFDLSTAQLVANPGCYATAAILAVAPLLAGGLLEDQPIVLDGKSGTTGAGRKTEEHLLFSEIAETVRPYRLGRHQHTPEIERALSGLAGRKVTVSLTAHLVPMRRGLLVSAYARPKAGTTPSAIDAALGSFYSGARFVRIANDRPAEPGPVAYTNQVEVGAMLDARANLVVAFGALDNLVKGAAGQAIQNMNRMLGMPAELGLDP
jgi:N-acetyl-gamma-glutamyl-phosphate reductase